jgi:hypothetical protein
MNPAFFRNCHCISDQLNFNNKKINKNKKAASIGSYFYVIKLNLFEEGTKSRKRNKTMES